MKCLRAAADGVRQPVGHADRCVRRLCPDSRPAEHPRRGPDHGGRRTLDTCDLAADGTPSATVAVLHIGAQELDYLALSDATIAIGMGSAIRVVSDDCIARVVG